MFIVTLSSRSTLSDTCHPGVWEARSAAASTRRPAATAHAGGRKTAGRPGERAPVR
ncbi:hypothetical protein SCOCK_140013 [Actinacidiphila cocklensis]|uniref:Uncharacterized protein n=1 Tax=Actinacidiphila cocklensis TaxID=887465 RepID=A0A9W4GNX1_9ACTN|nr:hypothetical protein SCOCK_140013 [Actinacidiphila cocklensis]